MSPPIRRLLGIPVFYKVIIANVTITCVLVLLLLALRHNAVPSEAYAAWGAVAAILGTGVVNALLVRAALHPFAQLSKTAARVTAGDYTARAEASILADADFERVRRAYNIMLDTVESAHLQQRQLFGWMLETGEKERDRVARALHDRIAQQLAAALLTKDLRTEVAAVIDDLCATAQTLQPAALRLLGLRGALNAYALSYEKRTGVLLQSKVDVNLENLDDGLARGLYRAIEDVTETLPLKPVDRVDVKARTCDHSVEAVISIGHGQEDESAYALSGAETFRMKERIAWLGGELTFFSQAGKTVVRVSIPINQGRAHGGYDSRLAC